MNVTLKCFSFEAQGLGGLRNQSEPGPKYFQESFKEIRCYWFIKNKIFSPLPDNFQTSMSFGDCCVDSATRILSKLDNRTLNLMWSGGIDSTVVFWALIGTGHPFHIHFDNTAQIEHPELWERIHNNEFKQSTDQHPKNS